MHYKVSQGLGSSSKRLPTQAIFSQSPGIKLIGDPIYSTTLSNLMVGPGSLECHSVLPSQQSQLYYYFIPFQFIPISTLINLPPKVALFFSEFLDSIA